jgi:HAMP domain-containing protein
MAKLIHSLQTKLIASFIILILFVAGATFIYTYNETKNAMLASTRDDMANTIGMIAQQFTPQETEAMNQLKAGQENTSTYQTLVTKMQTIRALSPNIINIYTMQINEGTVNFLVDDSEDDPASIEDSYAQPEQRLFDAVNGITASDNLYTDEFGTYLSAYAPLEDSAGNVIVIIGADMDASTVIQRESFVGNTIYLVIGAAVAVAALLVGYFSLTIIKDINKLNTTAEEISKGNMNVTVNVKRKDEIGDLAESFGRMVASIKFMMMDKEENQLENHR